MTQTIFYVIFPIFVREIVCKHKKRTRKDETAIITFRKNKNNLTFTTVFFSFDFYRYAALDIYWKMYIIKGEYLGIIDSIRPWPSRYIDLTKGSL